MTTGRIEDGREIPTFSPEIHRKLANAVHLGKTHFTGTNLLINERKPPQDIDVEAIIHFLLAADPPNIKNIGRHEHIRTTIQYDDKLAQRFGKDRNLMKVIGGLHDAGSVISQESIAHDDLWKIASQQIGIRQDILNLIHSPDDSRAALKEQVELGLNDEEIIEKQLAETPDEKKLSVLADMCGKRFPMNLPPLEDGSPGVKAWDIITWEQSLARHIKVGNRLKQEGNSDYRLYELDTIRYQKIYEWAKAQGVDVADIRREIMEEEASLSPTTVLLDMGNVAMINPNPHIYAGFADKMKLSEQFVTSAFNRAVAGLETGTKSEAEFWTLFELALRKELPENYQELFTGPLEQTRNPVINKLIPQLKALGLQVGAFTDTVPAHKKVLEERGFFDGMDLVIASCDTKVTKSGNPQMAAKIAAAYAGYKPHQELLLIDDRMDISQAMSRFGVKVLPYDIRHSPPASLVDGFSRYNIQVAL